MPKPEFEVAPIDDPELIEMVAIAVLQYEGRHWMHASTNERHRATKLAEIAVATFLQQFLVRSPQ
jgi:hypothetical protein